MNVHMVVRRERVGHKIHSGQVESRMRMALVEGGGGHESSMN